MTAWSWLPFIARAARGGPYISSPLVCNLRSIRTSAGPPVRRSLQEYMSRAYLRTNGVSMQTPVHGPTLLVRRPHFAHSIGPNTNRIFNILSVIYTPSWSASVRLGCICRSTRTQRGKDGGGSACRPAPVESVIAGSDRARAAQSLTPPAPRSRGRLGQVTDPDRHAWTMYAAKCLVTNRNTNWKYFRPNEWKE